MNALAQARRRLRHTSWPIFAFGCIHLLIGGAYLLLLFESKCVDLPGIYGFDDCSDAWRAGHAPFVLGTAAIFMIAALGILRASQISCFALLAAIALYFAFDFYVSVEGLAEAVDLETGRPYGWSFALHERWLYFVEVEWLWPLLWLLFDAWFLFGSRARESFRRPPNTSLERTREG